MEDESEEIVHHARSRHHSRMEEAIQSTKKEEPVQGNEPEETNEVRILRNEITCRSLQKQFSSSFPR